MKRVMEGSRAVSEMVRLCRPQVISAYPITPQTHIVENLAEMVANGELETEFVNVESEFSAASVVLVVVIATVVDCATVGAVVAAAVVVVTACEVAGDVAGVPSPPSPQAATNNRTTGTVRRTLIPSPLPVTDDTTPRRGSPLPGARPREGRPGAWAVPRVADPLRPVPPPRRSPARPRCTWWPGRSGPPGASARAPGW